MPITFVAEVSSNHYQDLARCLRFVDSEVVNMAITFVAKERGILWNVPILTKHGKTG